MEHYAGFSREFITVVMIIHLRDPMHVMDSNVQLCNTLCRKVMSFLSKLITASSQQEGLSMV
jgi:hypothetical protein